MLNSLLLSDLVTGLVTFGLGLAVVFFGIAVLVVAVWAIGKILNSKKEKPAPVETVKEKVPAENEDEVPAGVVAAITAALYEYYTVSGEKCEFTIRKISRRS